MYRYLIDPIKKLLLTKQPPIIILLGLRQTGKTTLVKTICKDLPYQFFSFDLASDKNEFALTNRHALEQWVIKHHNKTIIIDEVQKMPETTSIIKFLYDNYHTNFILTGSSEIKIKNSFQDSLAGRTHTFHLYPLSIKEILIQRNKMKIRDHVDSEFAQKILYSYLVYGSMPRLQNIKTTEYQSFLKDFVDALLSKDILDLVQVKNSTKIYMLARLLAMQIGQLVNVNELSILLETPRSTIYHYLDILEQLNIICKAHPLSTNERQAISEKFKVYFTDLGLRNALINNFENLTTRLDRGALLENAVFLGIKRRLDYESQNYQMGFFRSAIGTEIDIVVKKLNQELLYEVKTTANLRRRNTKIQYITLDTAWEYL